MMDAFWYFAGMGILLAGVGLGVSLIIRAAATFGVQDSHTEESQRKSYCDT
jgi:hypothetical protein